MNTYNTYYVPSGTSNLRPTTPAIGTMWFDNWVGQFTFFTGLSWEPVVEKQSVENLCKIHPGLQELKNQLDEAQKKFDVYLALVKE
jgi:hypothetical protein